MPKADNPDPNNWSNDWKKFNPRFPVNRMREFIKDKQHMDISNGFDEFFKHGKEQVSKDEWERFLKKMQSKMRRASENPNMVIMFEEDYENLLEMRGLFKSSNRPEYVTTINKILGNLKPQELQ